MLNKKKGLFTVGRTIVRECNTRQAVATVCPISCNRLVQLLVGSCVIMCFDTNEFAQWWQWFNCVLLCKLKWRSANQYGLTWLFWTHNCSLHSSWSLATVYGHVHHGTVLFNCWLQYKHTSKVRPSIPGITFILDGSTTHNLCPLPMFSANAGSSVL